MKCHQAAPEFQGLLASSPAWAGASWVCYRLVEAGFQAVLAGGAVRDALLGLSPREFDVATSARPEQVEALFPKTIPVGKSFGVIVVSTETGPVEVATFRADGPYTDRRHPDGVAFADLSADAERRDFTINALFYDLEKQAVIDAVGGLEDLQASCIRAVGEPVTRFTEDALRVMRALRFVAQLGFSLEAKTEQAVQQLGPSLKAVSRERMTAEFDKLLLGEHADRALKLFRHLGLSDVVFTDWAARLWPVGISVNHLELQERRIAFYWPILTQTPSETKNQVENHLRNFRYSRDFIALALWLKKQETVLPLQQQQRLRLECRAIIDPITVLRSREEVDAAWASGLAPCTPDEEGIASILLFLTDSRFAQIQNVLERAIDDGTKNAIHQAIARRSLSCGRPTPLPSAREVIALRGEVVSTELGAMIRDLHRQRLLRCRSL